MRRLRLPTITRDVPWLASSTALLSGLLVSGCTSGAVALQTGDGGAGVDALGTSDAPDAGTLPQCGSRSGWGWNPPNSAPYTTGWSVVAHGALEYAASTLPVRAETPVEVMATLTSVDAASSALTLTTTSGTIEVTLTPVPAEWLAALPLDEAVIAHFENGLEVRRASDGFVLLALVARLGHVHSPSFDVGALHVQAGADECISVSTDGVYCWFGSVRTATQLTLGSTTVVAETGTATRIADSGRAYGVTVIGSMRQATDPEVMPYATGGIPACAPGFDTVTVVAIGPAPDALLPCTDEGQIAPGPGYLPTIGGWSVAVTGALTINVHDISPYDVDGMLTAADATGHTLDIDTAAGVVHVALEPVEDAWLTALPIGRAVHAHFRAGLVLTDAVDGSLLLAVIAGTGNVRAPSFDVGPIHVEGARERCVSVTYGGFDCVLGGTALDATFTLGASSTTLRRGAPAVRLEDAGRTFEVRLVGSLREATPDELASVGFANVCLPALMTATVVAIGVPPP